jgi:DNA-binding CsgD family transcriptional regulator/ligand-binding sensor domain-containing protein
MNFFKYTLFFFVLIPVYFYAQELPPIVNYTVKDYSGENQNWKIDQSLENYIYVGNNKGLMEFNGAEWKIYPASNNSIIRSVKVIDGKIFTGCYMDFGYWEKNNFGNLTYTSLVEKLVTPLLNDESFWNIVQFENYVLFQSLKRIYIYSLIDESIKTIEAPSKRAVIFIVDDVVYFQKSNEGIFKIENGKSTLIFEQKVLKDQEIVGAFLVNDKTLFITEKGGFYFFKKGVLSQWDISSNQILKSQNIYSSCMLSDGSFVLGSISNGIYHINSQGDLIQHINKEKGLLDNTVLCVFEDKDKNIWLGLDDGLSIINLDSPYNVYDDIKGTLGTVYTSLIFQNNLYVGTNQGLFYKPFDSNEKLQIVNNTQGQVWCLKVIDNTLFCGHNSGTFEVSNGSALKISDIPGTWDIKKIDANKNILLQGNYDGLSVLEKVGGNWKFRNKIEGFNISSRFIEFVKENELLINHEYDGIFKLKLNAEFTEVESELKFKPFGVESSLVTYKNKVFHSSSQGVYQFLEDKNKFEKDSLLSSLLYKIEDPIKGNLILDTKNNLWGFSDRNIVLIKYDAIYNKPKRIDIPVKNAFRSSSSVSGFANLNYLMNDIYLIGNTNGFTTLNLDRLKTNNYNIFLNSVYKQELNAPKEQLPVIGSNSLEPNQNNLFFAFSVPEFHENIEVAYSYRLKGYNDKWSDWNEQSNVSYENLSHGRYNFEVKARIGNVISDNIAVYSFEIEPPFYLSNLAYVFYSVCFILLFVFINSIYKFYHKKQTQLLVEKNQRQVMRIQLEKDKEIIKLKNEKLQQEIDNKTRELSVSTMSIIKKNEILNTIKNELADIKDDKKVKPVIKIINTNLTNTSDWKMFQEAFNNADRDFLKKIKEIHPNLTPNDLRLCAYLRMNLSSKELARLLSISVKSVEIKRHRLRKKMELVHKTNLVDYILNVC